MPPRAPELPEGIIEQIFLRLPPDEPACLMRASLASKLWLAHLSSARFRGLYCELHGSPPMLGFIFHLPLCFDPGEEEPLALFVCTTKFGVSTPNNWGHRKYHVRDCRHGLVLLVDDTTDPKKIVVWDPITGKQSEIHLPAIEFDRSGVSVLCALTGCDNHACHEVPFQVIFFGLVGVVDGDSIAYVHVYSQETGDWSEQCSSLDLGIEDAFVETRPPVLIGNTLYIMISDEYDNISILSYNLGSNGLSQIDVPPGATFVTDMLIATEDRSLGFAHLSGPTLYVWSRQMSSDRIAAWTEYKVIGVHIQSPIESFRLTGYVEGSDIIFLTTKLGIYEINLKLLRCKKLWKEEQFFSLLPYKSFYSPQGKSLLAKKDDPI